MVAWGMSGAAHFATQLKTKWLDMTVLDISPVYVLQDTTLEPMVHVHKLTAPLIRTVFNAQITP